MAGGQHRDLYEVLGVDRGTDAAGIRKAYRDLARRHHPDLNPGDAQAEERFKAISEAYAVLSDPERRRNYDEFGELSLQSGFDADEARSARDRFRSDFHAHGGFTRGGGEGFAFGDLGDLLGDLFGDFRGRASRPRRGADLEASLELEFLEATRGCSKTLSVTRPSASGGTRMETVTVRIPPGVRDRGRIRLTGKGAESQPGAPPGDLYVRIHVRPHPVFRAEGRDLHMEVPISVREAVHGARVEIPTLSGRATLTVPPGTSSGTRLRLRGKGIPGQKGAPAGDLYVVLQICVPSEPPGAPSEQELASLDPADLRQKLFS